MACELGNRTSRATSTSTGVRLGYETFNDAGERHDRLRRRSTRACTAARGRARSRTSPSTTASSRSTRPATAVPDARSTRRRTTTSPWWPTRSRSSTTSASNAPCWPASASAPGRRLLTAALHPDRVQGVVAVAPWARDFTPPIAIRLEAAQHFDEELDDYSGWFGWNRHFIPDHWPDYAAFFFANMLPEPHSTKQLEDIHAYNCATSGHVMLAENGSRRHPGTPEEAEALLRGIVAARAGHPGHRRPLPAARTGRERRPLDRGRAPRPRGRGSPADGPASRTGQPGHQELRGPGRRRARPAAASGRRHDAPAAGAVPQLADRARPRAPRPRHRRRHARAAARPGDPVADPVAGGGVPRAARRGRAPRLAAPRQRVRPLRVGVGRARPARVPGRAADGRGAGQQLHGVRRPGRTGALRPVAGRRGLGPRPLPAREPRAQAGAVRLDDRLRRAGCRWPTAASARRS